MKYKNKILFSSAILVTFGLLVLLEMTVPNFTRFFPVQDNKLLVIFLNVNILLILSLIFLITRIFLKSYMESKKGIWGAGLKKRLTFVLLIVSVVPSFTLFILIMGFFNQSIDQWFGSRIENTLDNALSLSEFHYEDIFRRYDRISDLMSKEIVRRNLLGDEAGLRDYMRRNEKVYFFEYQSVHDLMANAVIRVGSQTDIEDELSAREKEITEKGKSEEIIPVSDGEMMILARAIYDTAGHPIAVLFIGDKMKLKGKEQISEIASIKKEFRESRVMKKVLKYSFALPLFLVTMLTIFFSLWMGVKMANEITGPIEKIREGADIVAKGKFDINLEAKGKDEIGTLVRAFNSMAKELQVAKDEIEERRRYMEVILDNVATGIISTDKNGYVLLLNRAARAITGIEGYQPRKTHLKDVFGESFKMFTRSLLKDVKHSGGDTITRELLLDLRKKDTVNLRTSLTLLRDEAGKTEGFIIAFDDITHIVRAEKLATWRDVARKMTHEIKNPLTPIILSAERIRRKIMSRVQAEEDKSILDETTSVIIQSVEDIKGIVNELTKLT
ncbi:MAG TPA: HAMP domain-containing protein, partial [Syntrophorhabdaceae bacterium]|nr:HAMP domain-containing protein [Syntrophorhabdaceae bacterium]